MSIKRMVLVAVASLLLGGCIFNDQSGVYRRTGTAKPIQIPPGMSATKMEPLYPIPSVNVTSDAFSESDTDDFVVPRPAPMSPERAIAKIKLQKVAGRRWILAEATTSQVWPLTQSYLSSMNINVASSQPSSGLILTDWIVFKATPEKQSRYRISIEKGVGADTTEIHIVQQTSAVNAGAVSQWPTTSDDAERESWLLEDMANSLAGNIANKAASLLGQAVGGEPKSTLFMDGSEPALKLRLNRDRAWATLVQAMDKEGFINWGDDAEQSLIYVQFNDAKEAPGWFKRWFYPNRFLPSKIAPHTLEQILQHLSNSAEVKEYFASVPKAAYGEPLKKSAGYLVLLRPRDGDYVATIRSANGERLDFATNKRLLTVIHRNLI